MKRAKHSLSNYKLLSCDMGEIIPIGLTEVLAGDSIQQSTNALVRAAPLLAPPMHPVNVAIHHWFVPNRLIWEDWEKFITGGPDGMDASVFPTINMPASTGFAVGSLADYLGVPTGVADDAISALPFRAYALIFNEWYRDQDLVTPLVIDTTSGPDTTTSVALQNGAWERDYFTTARPWEQKGPAITVPLGTTAPVVGIGFDQTMGAAATNGTFRESDDPANPRLFPFYQNSNQAAIHFEQVSGATNSGPKIFTDLSAASAVTVNVLREALALQRYEEARARYGSRYTEYLQYLGIRSSDARLQRPEYLGGGKETIQFSEVLQTGEGTDPVGTLRGHGIASMRSNRYRRFFEEHGYVITVLIARPKAIYSTGLHRTWNRRTKEDYWQKELEHIGQQSILNKEVYAAHATPDGTFGYQDRYDDYRSIPSSIGGEFRSTLDYWHFARIFGSTPALNADFVKCVPTEEPFATDEDTLQIMAKHHIQARRLVCATGTSFIY